MASFPSLRSASIRNASKQTKPKHQRSRRKLSLERLESRRLLAVFIVDTFTDSSTGICGIGGSGNSGCSLRSAIIAANAAPGADTINLPVGTHTLSLQNSLPVPDQRRGDLNITDSLTIRTTDVNLDPATTVVDAAQIDRVFAIGGPTPITVVFNGITVQNGLAPLGQPGGGIDSFNTSLELRSVIVQNNRVDSSIASGGDADGGGISFDGSLLLDDVSINDNFAEDFGGGIAMFSAGTLSVRDSNISNNTAGLDGGGVWAGNGENYQINFFESVLIDGNQAGPSSSGGGIYVDGGLTAASVNFSLVDFNGNTSGDAGGGAYIYRVGTFNQNRGFYQNNQSGDGAGFGGGGGLYLLDNGTSTIDGTIFRNNVSVSGGGGAAVLTDATFRNTVFDNNRTTSNSSVGTLRFDDGGGAIAIASDGGIVGPTVRIENSSILNNSAPLAGGIGSANANLAIVNATIQGNTATDSFPGAGGIGFAQDDTGGIASNRVRLTITGSTISGNNSASDAGGIGVADADASITNSTISGNQASGRGAGVGIIGLNNAPNLSLNRVTVDNNSALTDGGGIAVVDASFFTTNTTISNNIAGNNGGGIAFASADPLLTGAVEFSTIATNRANFVGSNVAVNGSVTRFLSSIVAEPLGNVPIINIVSGGPGEVTSQGFNLFANSNFSNPSPSDLLGVNPRLGALANNGGTVRTRALLTGSPAIDAGANAPLAVDARGLPRPVDGDGNSVARNDIGAFELQALAVVVNAANSTLNVTEDINSTINLSPLVTVTGSSVVPTFTITTQPARGSVTISGNTATFVPAKDDFTVAGTPLTFVYTATVGAVSDTGVITVNISPVNDPPVFAADTAVAAVSGIPLTIVGSTVLTNDRPGPANETGTVTISAVTPTTAQGGTLVLNGQNLVYRSAVSFTGIDTITYRISDGLLTTTATLRINVTAAVVTVTANDSTLAATEDTNATLNLRPLVAVTGSSVVPTFTIRTQPSRGNVTISGSTATFVPAKDDFTVAGSPLTFVYTATVGAISDTGTIRVNISPVNDPPVFAADAAVAAVRGTPLTIVGSTVLTNDRPGPANETGTVTISAVTPTTAQGGTLALNGQNLVYRSAASFTGTDTITYQISDGLLTTTATLGISVTAAAVTVTASDSTLAATEDTNATLNLRPLVAVTGSSVVPTFTIRTQPARGTVTISGSTATFVPAKDDFTVAGSPLTFVYTATVGAVSDTGTIRVNISPVNDRPVFAADSPVTAVSGTPLTVVGSTVLINDRPGPANETGTVTISAVTPTTAQGGTLALNGQNLVYRSAASFTGTDTITYQISDGSLTTTATLGIRVNAAVLTVTANDSTLAATEDTNATLNLLSLVTVTGSSVAPTFRITTQPARGTVTVSGNTVTFVPAKDDFTVAGSPLTFVYTATVGSVSDTGRIVVSVAPVNDRPLAGDDVINVTSQLRITIPVLANDVPGPLNESTQSLTITAVTPPAHGIAVLNASRSAILYTPEIGFTGVTSFTYTVVDGGGVSDTAKVTVKVPGAGVQSELTGQVTCDTNGNGVVDSGEEISGVTVFMDQDGDRLLDSGELRALTDLSGNYRFTGLNFASGHQAIVVLDNPANCKPLIGEIGVTRAALQTGLLSRGIASTDIDGDDDIDLLVVNDLSNDVTVLLNDNNTGGFTLGSPIQLGKRPQSISIWQRDSESEPVIAVAAVGDVKSKGSIYVIENRLVRELSAGDGPVSVVANDFNGDGKADFVAASFRSGTIVGRMSGETSERILGTARSPRSVKSAFINDDRFLDLVVVGTGYQNEDSSEVVVLLGDGRGNFTTLNQKVLGQGFVDVEAANFDSDRSDEIAIASYSGKVQVFDFSGGVLSPIGSISTQIGVESIAARDIDGDGRTDLVVANAKTETIELFVNTPSGFVRNRTITGVASPTDIVIANFDNDDVLDVAVSNLYGQTKPNYVFPSTATILGLTVAEQEVTFSANQISIANFGLVANSTPTPVSRPLAQAERNFDVNGDGRVVALDALLVINSLSRQRLGEGESTNRRQSHKLDVNGDGKTTALDALQIINQLSKQRRAKTAEGGQLVELTDSKRKLPASTVDAVMAAVGELF